MTSQFSEFTPRTLPQEWSALIHELQVPPLIARVLAARGIKSSADLVTPKSSLLPPDRLPDIKRAAARLVHAIQHDEHILIAGDFDADGATAAVLTVDCLTRFGAKKVSFAVPNRFEFGYGLSKNFVNQILPRQPQVIVTVDNGISSVEGVLMARNSGVDVIITDHHIPPTKLPQAHAIVNPKMPGCGFTSEPAGVGVVFYLMIEVRCQLRASGHFQDRGIKEPNLMSCVDLVAIGTVADMVPLDFNNRLLVRLGLEVIRRNKLRPGLQVLIDQCNVQSDTISEEDIGFRLAPRLNAAGRLEDMTVGIRGLLAPDYEIAEQYISRLRSLNEERQDLQGEAIKLAVQLVSDSAENARGFVVHHTSFHEGIVGLVAGHICRQYHRPTIIFADSLGTSSNLLKGSGRSIVDVHMRDILAYIDAKYPNLICGFGGHAAAAGLTIHKDSLARFETIFHEVLTEQIPLNNLNRTEVTDGELESEEFTCDFVQTLLSYGPWGMEFPRPLFHGEFKVLSQQHVKDGKHLKLVVTKDQQILDAIAFSESRRVHTNVTFSYHPAINTFNQTPTVQLVIQSITPSSFVS